MSAQELQDAIFQDRLKQGDVSLGLIPSVTQLNWLLFIDNEKDYMNYTPEQVMEDIELYFAYQTKRRYKPYENR